MRAWSAASLAALLIAGCAGPRIEPEPVVIREPVEVRVPVEVKTTPPERLYGPVQGAADLPTFVSPQAPNASSALTPEGEQRLLRLLFDLRERIRQWEAWGRQ